MNRLLKRIALGVAFLVVLFVIALQALPLFMPDSATGWLKPGISQDEIPAGVSRTVVIKDVTVIPMDSERILEGQTVVIEDRRITGIGTAGTVSIPDDAHIIDGDGKYLIPGLADMHTHVMGAENDLLLYLANGVTTIRTLGGGHPAVLDWRDEIRKGDRVGPNIWSWWPMLETNQEESFEWGAQRAAAQGKVWIHSPEEARELVAEMAELGVDGIKSHGQPRDVFVALLEASNEQGLAFDGHAPEDHYFCPSGSQCEYESGQEAWEDFRTLGVPALAHLEELVKMLNVDDIDARDVSDENIREIAQDVAEDEMWITSTVYLFQNIVDQAADLEGQLAAMDSLKYVHPGVFAGMKWGPGENYYVELGNRSYYSNYLSAQEKMLLALYEADASLLSGTDANSPVIVPGFSLHDELETMVGVGIPPYDALKTSTYNPALYLGELDEFGTIEEGKRADLVLLDGNPLEDITNTRKIAGVVAQGTYYTSADLDIMLEGVVQTNEEAESARATAKILYPALAVLLLVGTGFMVVRIRRGSNKNATD